MKPENEAILERVLGDRSHYLCRITSMELHWGRDIAVRFDGPQKRHAIAFPALAMSDPMASEIRRQLISIDQKVFEGGDFHVQDEAQA